jgi:hypothetical protein
MGLWQDGWDAFVTPVHDFNDGLQSCDAMLQATHNTTDKTISFYGDTSNGHGHAEMDALYQFLKGIGWNVNNFGDYTLTITCLSKPCCKYCAAVMGLCNVFATEGTYKVNKTMGISYAMPMDVRSFLGKLLNTTESKILSELCG